MNSSIRIYFFIAMITLLTIMLFQWRALFGTGNEYKHHHSTKYTVGVPQGTHHNNIILWWTPFIGKLEYTRTCESALDDQTIDCLFTENRAHLQDVNSLKAIMFYGSNLKNHDFPLPRISNIPWILFHEESPKNVPFLSFESAISLFNVTATFSQHSSFPLTLQYLGHLDDILDRTYFISVTKKNDYQADDQIASVLYIQSICNSMTGRDDYVQELMKFIDVDSYGKCLNNKELPESLSGVNYLSTIKSEEYYKFIARYKFVIAFENSVCDDYITEKLWTPLRVGIVPIYFGAPNIKSWLPNPKSAILVSDFDSPRHLAEHLLYLNEDDIEYNSYLDHKKRSMDTAITNNFLVQELTVRNYEEDTIIPDFECFVCQNVQQQTIANSANKLHYNCGNSAVYPKMFEDAVATTGFTVPKNLNDWQNMLLQGKCEADLLNWFVLRNRTFAGSEFDSELLRRYDVGSCGIL